MMGAACANDDSKDVRLPARTLSIATSRISFASMPPNYQVQRPTASLPAHAGAQRSCALYARPPAAEHFIPPSPLQRRVRRREHLSLQSCALAWGHWVERIALPVPSPP